MRLRTKIFLGLLPVILPLLFYSLYQVKQQQDISQARITQVADLTLSFGRDALIDRMNAIASSQQLVSNSLNICFASHDDLRAFMQEQMQSHLMGAGHINLMVLMDLDGTISLSHITPIESNRHILPRRIKGTAFPDPAILNFLAKSHEAWQVNKPERIKQLISIQNQLRSYRQSGALQSEDRLKLLGVNAQLQQLQSAPPTHIFLGGQALLKRMGIHYTDDSYLFARMILDCNQNPIGYSALVVDWGGFEKLLTDMRGAIESRGLPGTRMVLFDPENKRFLPKGFSLSDQRKEDRLKSHLAQSDTTGLTFIEDLNAWVGTKTLPTDRIFKDVEPSLSMIFGNSPIGNYKPAGITPLKLVAYIPVSDDGLFKKDYILPILLAMFVTLGLLLLIIEILSRRITGPISQLRDTMRCLSTDQSKPHAIDVTSQDEIGDLQTRFNEMAQDLYDQKRALEAQTRALEKATKDANSANRAKSNFLANMSHELRTPLNAINGFSEAMMQQYFGEIPPKYREYATHINTSGVYLLQIISDILDLTKVEVGKLDLTHETIHGSELIDDVILLFRSQFNGKDSTIVTQTGDVVPLKLGHLEPSDDIFEGDYIRVKQILINILSNAIKYSPDRTAIITLATTMDHIIFSIADNGPGMTKSDIKRASRPFGRAGQNSQIRKIEGTGLGIPLTMRLVALHGGTMQIVSKPKQGTEIIISLPRIKSSSTLENMPL